MSGSSRSRSPRLLTWWRYQPLVWGANGHVTWETAFRRVVLLSVRASDKMRSRYDDRRHGRPSRPPDDQKSTRQRATDQEIQKSISRQHGFVPESAWIAHCKELFGLAAPVRPTTRIRARQKRLQRLSRHSDTSDCSERLSKKERSDPNSVPTSSNLVSRQ